MEGNLFKHHPQAFLLFDVLSENMDERKNTSMTSINHTVTLSYPNVGTITMIMELDHVTVNNDKEMVSPLHSLQKTMGIVRLRQLLWVGVFPRTEP